MPKSVTLNYVVEKNDQDTSIQKALDTFVLLRKHPLALKLSSLEYDDNTKFSDRHVYYFWKYRDFSPNLMLETEEFYWCSWDALSAMFKTRADAIKAKEDIGEDNLIHMFRFFGDPDYE